MALSTSRFFNGALPLSNWSWKSFGIGIEHYLPDTLSVLFIFYIFPIVSNCCRCEIRPKWRWVPSKMCHIDNGQHFEEICGFYHLRTGCLYESTKEKLISKESHIEIKGFPRKIWKYIDNWSSKNTFVHHVVGGQIVNQQSHLQAYWKK